MLMLWRKWIAYPIGWLVLMLGFIVVLAVVPGWSPTQPDMKSFEGHYEARIVDDAVQLNVTERILVRLENERGIFRTLVTAYGDSRLGVTGISVVDGGGGPVPFRETSDPRTGDIEIRIGDPNVQLSGNHSFILSYSISNAMVEAGDFQNLYFNTNGTQWRNGFKEFSAELTVDDALAAHLTGAVDCYKGRAGSRGTCTLQQSGRRFSVQLPNGLKPRENVTLDIGFDPGTVANPLPPFKSRSHEWEGIAILLGIGGAALLLSLLARWRVRDLKRAEPGIVTQFTPPGELSPLAAADFLGRSEKGAAAHLAWLVVNGYAKLTADSDGGEKLPGPNSDDLSSAERRDVDEKLRFTWHSHKLPRELLSITQSFFGDPDKAQRLSAYRRYSDLTKAERYRKQLVLGLRKDSHLAPWLLWLGYLALIGYGAYQVWIGLAGLGPWFLLAGVVSTMLLLISVHVTPPYGRLTKEGRELRRYLIGLERFVTTSEANRIAWLQNAATAPREDDRVHLYEKLLPWAIIFGAEQSWAQLLGDMYDRFPELRTSIPQRVNLTNQQWTTQDRDFYNSVEGRSRTNSWARRSDIGEGALARGWKNQIEQMGERASGMGSSDSSTRSSGRGWSGGSSSRSSGSRSSGRSGGGVGGGGGGRW